MKKIETGPTMTEEINVGVPEEGGISQVEINMGGGDLLVKAGEIGGLIEGSVTTNAEDLRPRVRVEGRSVVIEQGDVDDDRLPLGGWSDVENHWDLTLGTAPMDLTVRAGAAEAVLSNLADLNARQIDFDGGAGDFTLDFAGDLKQDMQVTVNAGAAEVTIVVPQGTAAEATFLGALTDIDPSGGWRKSGNEYTLEGEGPTIRFEIHMGVGNLKLRNQ